MDNNQFQELVLQQLKTLTEGQASLEKNQAMMGQDISSLKAGQARMEQDISTLKAGQTKLEAGQREIRNDLKYIWDDIKKIDDRLSRQEQETTILKRMK